MEESSFLHQQAFIKHLLYACTPLRASQVALVLKNPGLRRPPWRRKWQPTHSSILAWRIPWTEELGGL